MNKKYLIIVITFMVLLCFIIIIRKKDSNINNWLAKEVSFENSQNVSIHLEEVFSQIEKEYKENEKNGIRELQSEIDDIIRDNFEKIVLVTELPEDVIEQFQDNIDISDNSLFQVGNKYLIKYQGSSERYTYYFVSQLTKKGFGKFYLYAITEEEYENDFLIDENIDNVLE